jgi:hypothetical protein
VFFYLLFFLLIFLIPIGTGFFLAMGLRELYLRQLAENKIEEENSKSLQENVSVPIDNASFDVEEPENSESAESALLAENGEANKSTETAAESESAESSSSEQIPVQESSESENELKSVFNSPNLPFDPFKINEVLDEMVSETVPEIPSDLSSMVENEKNSPSPEELRDQFDDTSDDEEPLAETLAMIDSKKESPEIEFNETENSDSAHPDIAPMAVELLSEDFDFNSLLGSEPNEPNVEQDSPPVAEINSETEEDIDDHVSANEIGLGLYQAEGNMFTPNQTLSEHLQDEQEVISFFPDNLIQDAVIEPDQSETAMKFSFTAESQPMFVRKRVKE